MINGFNNTFLASFTVYSARVPPFRGGVRVAVEDLDGNGSAEIITGAGPGGRAHAKIGTGNFSNAISLFVSDVPFGFGIYVG